ncbi:MAG: bifunctional adenosylcobinamide kinase/adenosylcobinamide-phosphate guanylyltransferase [Bradyrhizobium sp.]
MILVGGGSRSGKSRAALDMLQAAGPHRAFIATAQAWDDEMRQRIALHREERGPEIVTWEEPFDVAERIEAESDRYDAIVVDCLTLWLSNLMLAESIPIESQCRKLVDVSARAQAKVILVTNEVGCGIVPDNALARRFRDAAGRLNQLAAQHASEVHWMVFGIGMRIK